MKTLRVMYLYDVPGITISDNLVEYAFGKRSDYSEYSLSGLPIREKGWYDLENIDKIVLEKLKSLYGMVNIEVIEETKVEITNPIWCLSIECPMTVSVEQLELLVGIKSSQDGRTKNSSKPQRIVRWFGLPKSYREKGNEISKKHPEFQICAN